jgi:DNA-binding NarL/FixJ family response regulator
MQKNILIVDDHFVVSIGISIILQERFPEFSIDTADTYFELLNKLEQSNLDLILLDINIPGGKNTDMIQEIKSIQPEVKILMVSSYDEKTHACPYIMAGANGYLNKLCDKNQITSAVDLILQNGSYLPPSTLENLIQISTNKISLNPLEQLSKREKEITELLILGDGNIEIANKLDINLTTVSTHKNKIFSKLKVKNVIELSQISNKMPGLNN